MRVDPLYLSLALVLLWLPLALLLGRRRRRELRNPAGSALVTLPALLASPWSWLDLIRAAGGTWLLAHKVLLPPTAPLRTIDVLAGLLVQMLPLIPAVWIQVMLTGSRRLRLAPLFFAIGIAAIILPWQVSIFGGVLAFTLTGMLRRWRVIFWIMPVCLVGTAALFRMVSIACVLVPLLFVLPALLGVRPERPLSWVFNRARALDPKDGHRSDRRRRRRSRHTDARPGDDRRATPAPVTPVLAKPAPRA